MLAASACAGGGEPQANGAVPGSCLVLEERYCTSGEILELSVPRWDAATGAYAGPEADAVVCCVVAFTAPRGAAVFAPMPGVADNTGGAFWRNTASGEVVAPGKPLLPIQIEAAGEAGVSSTILFLPGEYPGEPCPGEEWDLRKACFGRGSVSAAAFLGRVAGEALPGFGTHTVIVKNSGEDGELLTPERLRELYGLRN